MEAVQVFPQMMEVAGDLVAKAQDWPGADELSKRLQKLVPPHLLTDKERQEMEGGGGQEQGIDPQQAMEAQAQAQEQMQKLSEELMKLKEQNLKLSLDSENKARELEIKEFAAETDRMKIIGEFAAKDEEFQLREIERESQMEESERDRQIEAQKASSGGEASTQPTE